MTAKNRFILFHGWLSDPAGLPTPSAMTIASIAPPLVISPMMTAEPKRLNLSRQVHRLFKRSGIRFFAYVPTGYGHRDHAAGVGRLLLGRAPRGRHAGCGPHRPGAHRAQEAAPRHSRG